MREAVASSFSLEAVAIERVSSLAFLDAVFAAQEKGLIALPSETPDSVTLDGLKIVARQRCAEGGGWFNRSIAPRHDPAPAQISLTSGTTGTPKPILLSHRALADVTTRLVEKQRLTSDVREYVGVPVTYSFGFGRIRAIAAVGGAAFLPEKGFRVDEFAAMLERGEVNALSAVPTLLRLVIAQRHRFVAGGQGLRWLEIGSQAMSVTEKQEIREIFPHARIIQHYGLTEASRTTFLAIGDEESEDLASVGTPNGAVEVRITPDGLIAIRGPHVAEGIVTATGVAPLTDADGWLVTNDLGRLAGGALYFEGRSDHLINVGGIKVPAELFEEKLFAKISAQTDVALDTNTIAVAPGKDPLKGETVVVAFRRGASTSQIELLDRISSEMCDAFGVRGSYSLLALDEIPRTETNKTKRKDITDRFAEQGVATAPPVREATEPEADFGERVERLFVEIMGPRARNLEGSFVSLGGDSLHYVSMLTGLESVLPRLPENWDELSIAELAALARAPQDAAEPVAPRETVLLPTNLDSVRGLACVMIVALHVVGAAPSDGLKLPASSMWHTVMDFLNLVRLPLFTAMAGFLYGAMPALRRGYGDFMGRKLRQMLPPLVFATLVFWTLRRVTYGDAGSLFWAYVDGYRHLWYIHALLLMFAIVALIDVKTRSRWVAWAVLATGVALVYNRLPDIPIMHFRNAMFLLPFFLFGLVLYRVPGLLRSNLLLGLCVVAAPVLLVAEYAAKPWLGAADPLGVMRWICGGAVIVVLLRLFPRVAPLQWVAVYSFTIYLWHPAANAVLRNVFWKIGITDTSLLFLLGMAAGLLVPIAMHTVAQRLPLISRWIVGR